MACNTAVPSMPGPRNSKRRALRQAFDLQDQRGRTIRIFVAAERKAIERGKRARHRRSAQNWQIEESAITGAPVWNLSHFATSDVSDIRGIEPDRRIVIEQGQRDRGGAAHHRRQARRRRPRCAARCRGAPSHPSRSGRSIAPTTPCRQTLRAVRQPSSSLNPHRAPACRNRPASPRSPQPCGFVRTIMAARSGASTFASTASA